MEFTISSFQFDSKCLFKISHKVDFFISEYISQQLEAFNPGFDLVFSISCNSENKEKLILTDQIRGRKTKEITQHLSFPNKYLENKDDWVLDTKLFDFKLKKNAYKQYPLDKYALLITKSLEQFFKNEKLDVKIDFQALNREITEHIKKNKAEFLFKNEELMNLKELINETHWSFEDGIGFEWQNSEIGKKWLNLKNKYIFDSQGNLKIK